MKRILFFLVSACAIDLQAQSRLPFLTNDTRTLEAGKKELSLAISSSSNSSSITFFVPNFDFVYGITNRWQIELQTSVGFYFFGAQDAVIGANNILLATKYLLLGNQKDGVSFSFAPHQSFPWQATKDDARLNPRETITLLPFEIMMRGSTGYVLIEAGFQKHSSTFNRKLMALAVGQYFSPEFEMMLEYNVRIRENIDHEQQSIVNLGGRYDYTKDLQMMFAIGGTTAIFFGEESTYFTYFGLKWRWGGASVPTSQPAVVPAAAPVPVPKASPVPVPSSTPKVMPVPGPVPKATPSPSPAVKPTSSVPVPAARKPASVVPAKRGR